MTNLLMVQRLKQFQLLSLKSKIRLTLARIKEWHIKYEGNVYLSFSGGKDSTATKGSAFGILAKSVIVANSRRYHAFF